MGIVCMYLAEILLELTLGPISTRSMNELLRERSPFSQSGSQLKSAKICPHQLLTIKMTEMAPCVTCNAYDGSLMIHDTSLHIAM